MERLLQAHLDHRRSWRHFDFCYPVISRRSRGVSLGVNLNPDKACNFDCVYCEVDRVTPPKRKDLDLDQMEAELDALLDLTLKGELFASPPFDTTPHAQRRLNDIAFSGDGEPTAAKAFGAAIERVAALKTARGLDDAKLVLITNATRLQHPEVVKGIDAMMAAQGEIWAKLDAGTEAHYRDINRSSVPFSRILENLRFAGRRWPLIIQTLLLSWQGKAPTDGDVAAYVEVLQTLREGGARIQGLQLYTIARPTPEPEAQPLPAVHMDRLAALVKDGLPDLAIDVFYGPEA